MTSLFASKKADKTEIKLKKKADSPFSRCVALSTKRVSAVASAFVVVFPQYFSYCKSSRFCVVVANKDGKKSMMNRPMMITKQKRKATKRAEDPICFATSKGTAPHYYCDCFAWAIAIFHFQFGQETNCDHLTNSPSINVSAGFDHSLKE